jgi:hypothetical protein
MNMQSWMRLTALVAATQVAACSRFVWHEDPFTPDPAPASETIVSARDTAYVLKSASYYLISSQRSALWNRDVMDDVAWRYRALFGEAPPVIAIRIDSASVPAVDSATTWRGVPFAFVSVRRRSAAAPGKTGRGRERDAQVDDSVHARIMAGPMLAATAAETWLTARTLDAARTSDSQPGGPVRTTTATGAALPAWIEAGALRILGSSGAPDRASYELRADSKHIVPLASLFTVAWTGRPNAMAIVRSGSSRFDPEEDDGWRDGGAPDRRAAVPASGASPLFIAQSVSVLAFIHERDPRLVARLADELTRGASIPDVLASSATLPHDVAGLDTAWRAWLKRTERSHR